MVTDSAANMVKAFKLPNYTGEGDDDDESVDSAEGDEMQPVTIDGNLDIDADFNDFYMDASSFSKRIACFTHVLQLVVKDGLKEAGPLQSVIAKASKLVSHVRKSHNTTELFESFRKLQPANATRWNSQLKMLRSIMQIPQDLLNQIDESFKLRPHDLKLISDLCEILQPYEEATDILQGERVVTSSEIIITVRSLKQQMLKLSEKYDCRLLKALATSLKKRCQDFEEKEEFQIATTLDPHYKLDWCTDNEVDDIKKLLLLKAEQFHSHSNTGTQVNQSDRPPPPKRRRVGLEFMKSRATLGVIDRNGPDSEVNNYLSSPCLPEDSDALEFWKTNETTFPTLAKIASIYLALPASSSTVERIFSIAGKIFRPERCSLSDKLFKDLMFIRCNEI